MSHYTPADVLIAGSHIRGDSILAEFTAIETAGAATEGDIDTLSADIDSALEKVETQTVGSPTSAVTFAATLATGYDYRLVVRAMVCSASNAEPGLQFESAAGSDWASHKHRSGGWYWQDGNEQRGQGNTQIASSLTANVSQTPRAVYARAWIRRAASADDSTHVDLRSHSYWTVAGRFCSQRYTSRVSNSVEQAIALLKVRIVPLVAGGASVSGNITAGNATLYRIPV